MVFVIVTVLCLLALLSLLSYHRFCSSPEDRYIPWLRSRVPVVIEAFRIQYFKSICRDFFLPRYPARQRWIYLALAFSYLYLVLSGFIFAFIGIRIFGTFLLLHVVLGALFAVCLCLAVVFRARYYTWHEEDGAEANLRTDAGKRKVWQVILFWLFVAAGFLLVVTALGQMLPSLSLRTQLSLFQVHRYAALAVLLAGIAFWHFSLVDEKR